MPQLNRLIPWFAIGGIDINNLDEVLNAGAPRVATVVRAIMEAEQPTLVTQFFISQLMRMQNLKAQKAYANRKARLIGDLSGGFRAGILWIKYQFRCTKPALKLIIIQI